MSKIITVIPVKNDAWFVDKSIRSAAIWSDQVIVADQCSDDGSYDIYRAIESDFSNVNIIYDRPKFDYNTPDLRNYLLNHAREFNGNNLIFEIHADEIMSADILNPEIRNKLLLDVGIGNAVSMPWINLWNKHNLYRKDKSVWSDSSQFFAFRDDRRAVFKNPVFHGSRCPEILTKNEIKIDYLKVMHYQFLNLKMERSKQALYQIFERNHYPNKNTEHINKIYAHVFDERSMGLCQLEDEHYIPWVERGIEIDKEYPLDGYNWRDTEVLKNFQKFGVKRYKNINIWYIDWEDKRKKAIKKGFNFTSAIVDPRSLSTKLSHKFLMKYQLYSFWRLDFYKLLIYKFMERVFKKDV